MLTKTWLQPQHPPLTQDKVRKSVRSYLLDQGLDRLIASETADILASQTSNFCLTDHQINILQIAFNELTISHSQSATPEPEPEPDDEDGDDEDEELVGEIVDAHYANLYGAVGLGETADDRYVVAGVAA